MNILLLSSGGGGGNILRSLKALFATDVALAHKSDAKFAERLRQAVTTRFLDTNEFSLSDVPKEERVLIGAPGSQRLGSGHRPDIARQALEESRSDVERLIAKYSVIIVIGTGGKGTGAGTMFPLAQIARQHRKLVIPVFVRPSFEQHEVDKRRYDHAVHVTEQFDAAGIRLIEILNDRAYSTSDPQPQSVVWQRMNLPIARGLRGLIYVLWDLSQVDPSDLSILLAGRGRMRMGFAEIDPVPGHDPSESQIDEAVQGCWHNSYYGFTKPVGTSLVCIQGDWSNLVDARIKGGLAALALAGAAESPYNPLYARAFHTPKPWGVTTLFTEYTGVHQPLELQWTAQRRLPIGTVHSAWSEPRETDHQAEAAPVVSPTSIDTLVEPEPVSQEHPPSSGQPFENLWDFARALSGSDRAALALAAEEGEPAIPIDGLEVQKLLGTFWFRSAFQHLSASWRQRILDTLIDSVVVRNHQVRLGRQTGYLRDFSYEQIREFFAKTLVRGPEAADLQLLLAVGNLWGNEGLRRLRFSEIAESQDSSRLTSILGGLR